MVARFPNQHADDGYQTLVLLGHPPGMPWRERVGWQTGRAVEGREAAVKEKEWRQDKRARAKPDRGENRESVIRTLRSPNRRWKTVNSGRQIGCALEEKKNIPKTKGGALS